MFTSVQWNATTLLNQPITTIITPISGNYRIDVLLDGANTRWGNYLTRGSPQDIYFSFIETSSTTNSNDRYGFLPFNDTQRTAARSILNQLGQHLNVTFRESSDSSTNQIRMANNDQGTQSSGYAYLPGNANSSGQLYLNVKDDHTLNPSSGNDGWSTLVHELGHALGLKHPGNYNVGDNTNHLLAGNYLATAEDTPINTVMTYYEHPQYLERIDFAAYDLLALQYLYGGRDTAVGNDHYVFNDNAGNYLQLLRDNGGIDTIDLSPLTIGATLNLQPGCSSHIGRIKTKAAAENNMQLAFDTVIENVIGSAYADTIVNNDANNNIDGGEGQDCVIYHGIRQNFTIQNNGDYFTIYDATNTENKLNGQDHLYRIERIKFDDQQVALDITGNAGRAYALLYAGLGRPPTIHEVAVWLAPFDQGLSSTEVAQLALNVVKLDHTELVSLLYQNIVQKPASEMAIAPFVSMLVQGKMSDAQFFAAAAELDLNKSHFIKLIGQGIDYAL